MSEELDFDLERKEVRLTIGGRPYALREPTEGDAVKWQNACQRAGRFDKDGRVTAVEGLAEAEPLLVSLCLFDLDPAGEKAVPAATVRGWPARVVRRLYDRALEMGELQQGPGRRAAAEEAAKNGHAASAGTSA